MRKDFLPFSRPSFGEAEIAEVVDTIRSGWVTTGPKTQRFETACRDYLGAEHAVAVSSCTAGLHLGLQVLGIGPGDEVIVPTMTFCSCVNVVVHSGAEPVVVDCREDFTIDPDAVRAAITPRTRAIMPVHYAGLPCAMDELTAIAAEHDLAMIEDAAHAIGAEYRGERIGSNSRLAVFSFYATKNLTTGEGGLVVSNEAKLADRVRHLSLHGMDRDAWKRYTAQGSWYYEVTDAGYKYNFTDLQAALGLPQLARLDDFIARRTELAERYRAALGGRDDLALPEPGTDVRHAWHLFVIRPDFDRLTIDRAEFINRLREMNIGTSVHFIPIHRHPFYSTRESSTRHRCPVADTLFDRIISLPLYPAMTDRDLDDVTAAVVAILESARR